MRHVHHDLIVAWAADTSRVVQASTVNSDDWRDLGDTPLWCADLKYRFRPEPKPDVVRYLMIKPHAGGVIPHPDDNIKVTWDGETGKLKVAEVIGE